MPLGLVYIQYLPGFGSQRGANEEKPFGDVFMYGALTHSEFFCSLPYRGIGFYNVMSDLCDSFFYIFFQKIPPGTCFYSL